MAVGREKLYSDYLSLRQRFGSAPYARAFQQGLSDLLHSARASGLDAWADFFSLKLAFEQKRLHDVINIAETALAHHTDINSMYNDELPLIMCAYNMAMAQAKQGSIEGELKSYDALVELFSDSINQQVLPYVARALINKGYRLGLANNHAEQAEAYSMACRLYAPGSTDEMMRLVAKALLNKGGALQRAGDINGALQCYEQVVNDYGLQSTSDTALLVASAHMEIEAINSMGIPPQPARAARASNALAHAGKLFGDSGAVQQRLAFD